MPSLRPKTLFEKIWDAHVVEAEAAGHPAVLYVDLHLVYEVTSPQAFAALRGRGLKVRRPDRTFATLDHAVPTRLPDAQGNRPYVDGARLQVEALERNARDFGFELQGWDSPHRGIVHVMAPELGLTLPASVIVCGDSHTATHGAFGALAFGIGTSEVGHVLATQCLLQRKPKTLRVTVTGDLAPGVTAKDLALALIAKVGAGGGRGYVVEYAGETIRALDMEGRMTLCNLSIELGARAGMIAPDEKTIAWLRGPPARTQRRPVRSARCRMAGARQRRRRGVRSGNLARRFRADSGRHLGHVARHWHRHRRAHSLRRKRCPRARIHAVRARPDPGRRGRRRRVHR